MALTDKLTAIADAIRDKTGDTALLTLDAMPTAISNIETGGGGDLTEEDLSFTGICDHLFRNGNWNPIIDKYSNKITLNNVTGLSYTFSDMKKADLSMLTIHLKGANISGSFSNSTVLEKLPKVAEGSYPMRYTQSLFNGCWRLTSDEINKFFTSLDLPLSTDMNTSHSGMFVNCFSVRDLTPTFEWFDAALNNYTGTSTSHVNYSQYLSSLYSLDKVTNLCVVRTGGARTSNAFSSAITQCYRLSDMMFKTDNGTPYSVNWKSQTIDLSTWIGYAGSSSNITGFNSGITADKEVKDDATYAALKNEPDWFSTKLEYSRYNHDSAVNTINSLPDTSAYLATAGGTNTIKFNGNSGSKTDGGAINTLTEEEIAIAAAKGWTVTLS